MTASLYQSGGSGLAAWVADIWAATCRVINGLLLRVLGRGQERALHVHDVRRLDARVQLDVVPAVAAPGVRAAGEQVLHGVARVPRDRLYRHLHPSTLPPPGGEVVADHVLFLDPEYSVEV